MWRQYVCTCKIDILSHSVRALFLDHHPHSNILIAFTSIHKARCVSEDIQIIQPRVGIDELFRELRMCLGLQRGLHFLLYQLPPRSFIALQVDSDSLWN